MAKFTVIDGTPKPESQETPVDRAAKRIKKMPKPGYMLQCHRCGDREVMVVYLGMLMRAGRPFGGTKQWICAACHRRGERVVLA